MRAAAVGRVAVVLRDAAAREGAVLLALVRRARADVAQPPVQEQARRRAQVRPAQVAARSVKAARAAAVRVAGPVVRPVQAGAVAVAPRTADRRSPRWR